MDFGLGATSTTSCLLTPTPIFLEQQLDNFLEQLVACGIRLNTTDLQFRASPTVKFLGFFFGRFRRNNWPHTHPSPRPSPRASGPLQAAD